MIQSMPKANIKKSFKINAVTAAAMAININQSQKTILSKSLLEVSSH